MDNQVLQKVLNQYGVKDFNQLSGILGGDANAYAAISQASLSSTTPVYPTTTPTATNASIPNVTIDGTSRNGIDYEKFNKWTGNGDWSDVSTWLGGTDANGISNTGIIAPVASLATSAFNGYMAYQALKETKANNQRNYELALEDQARADTRYTNLVNEKKRNAGLLMGNSNSYASTAGTVASAPYSVYA